MIKTLALVDKLQRLQTLQSVQKGAVSLFGTALPLIWIGKPQ